MKKRCLSLLLVFILVVSLAPPMPVARGAEPFGITVCAADGYTVDDAIDCFNAYKVYEISMLDGLVIVPEFDAFDGCPDGQDIMDYLDSDPSPIALAAFATAFQNYAETSLIAPVGDALITASDVFIDLDAEGYGYYIVLHTLVDDPSFVQVVAACLLTDVKTTYIVDPLEIGAPTVVNNVVLEEGSYANEANIAVGGMGSFAIEIEVPDNINGFVDYAFVVESSFTDGMGSPFDGFAYESGSFENSMVLTLVDKGFTATPTSLSASSYSVAEDSYGFSLSFDYDMLYEFSGQYDLLLEYSIMFDEVMGEPIDVVNTVAVEYGVNPYSRETGRTMGSSIVLHLEAVDAVVRALTRGGSGEIFKKISDPAILPGSNYGVGFSPDGNILVVAHDSSPYITMYDMSSGRPVKLPNPGTLPTGNGHDVAFSPDGSYMAIAHQNSPYITIYNMTSGSPIKIANPTLPAGNAFGVDFSSDGQYLAVAYETSPYVCMYSISSTGVFTRIVPATAGARPTGFGRGASFSPDGHYLAIAHSTTPFVTIYDVSGGTLAKINNPASLPASTGSGVSFSPDSKYLAVAHARTPFVTIYDMQTGVPVKQTNPADLPTGDGYGTSYSFDGNYLAISHAIDPFITIYDVSGAEPVKLDNPSILPTYTGRSVAFSYDTMFLAVGVASGSPGIVIYTTDPLYKIDLPPALNVHIVEDGNYTDKKALSVGDTVSFAIEVAVPETIDHYSNYTFVVHDDFNSSLQYLGFIPDDFLNTIEVSIWEKGNQSSKVLFPTTGYIVNQNWPSLTIDFDPAELLAIPEGYDLLIEFSSVINGNMAFLEQTTSTAKLEYSYNPNTSNIEFSESKTVELYTNCLNDIYRVDSDSYNQGPDQGYKKLKNPLELPPGQGYKPAYSTDGKYLAVVHASSPFVTIYDVTGLSPVKLPDPAALPTSTGVSAVFSPDSKILAVGHSSIPYLTIYDISSGVPVKITDPATRPGNQGSDVAFSPNGQYLAVAHTTTPFITVYDMTGSIPVKISNPASLPAGNASGVSFSPDGNYVALAHTTTPFLTIYNISSGVLVKQAAPALLPAGNASAVRYSPDGKYLAVANANSPFITIYDVTGSVPVKLETPPNILPAGAGSNLAFSPDSKELTYGHTGSPFITIYDMTGDSPIKKTNPDILPPAVATGTAYSPDGSRLAVGHQLSPFITIYSTKNYNETYDTKLPGAEFNLYKVTDLSSPGVNGIMYDIGLPISFTDGSSGTTIYDGNILNSNVYNTLMSDTGGLLELNGIGSGLYLLRETKAPEKYNIYTHDIYFEISFEQDPYTDEWVFVKKSYFDTTDSFLYSTPGSVAFTHINDSINDIYKTTYIGTTLDIYNTLSLGKNVVVSDGSIVKHHPVGAGETVNFEIKFPVPKQLSDFSDYTLIMHDDYDETLIDPIFGYDLLNDGSFIENLSIYSWQKGSSSTKVTLPSNGYAIVQNWPSLTVEFDFATLLALQDDYEIVIEYSIVANTNITVSPVIVSSAYLEYSASPYTSEIGHTDSSSVRLYTTNLSNIYKVDKDTYGISDHWFEHQSGPTVLPTDLARSAAYSPDGKYLAIASYSTPYIIIYDVSGETPIKLPNPTTLPTGSVYGVAFSSDSKYLAIAHLNSPRVTVYNMTGGAPTKIANPTLPTGDAYGVGFSDDGKWMAVAHNTSPFVSIYSLDTGIPVKITNPSTLPTSVCYNASFSPDSKYLVLTNSLTPYITIYDMSSGSPEKATNPSVLPANTAHSAKYSPDNRFLAVTFTSAPYLYIYDVTGSVPTKMTDPDVPPYYSGWDIAFSPDSKFLVVPSTTYPFLSIYDMTGDYPVLVKGPDIPLGGAGYGSAFSPDGKSLAITTGISPYVSIYSTPNTLESYDIHLPDTEFELYKLEELVSPGSGGELYTIGSPIEMIQDTVIGTIAYDGDPNASGIFTTLVSDSDGLIQIAGISPGLYMLHEIGSSYGYNMLGYDIFFNITFQYDAATDNWVFVKEVLFDTDNSFLFGLNETEFEAIYDKTNNVDKTVFIENEIDKQLIPTIIKYIVDKNGGHTDSQSVSVGDSVNMAFEITLPADLQEFDSYVFTIHDNVDTDASDQTIGFIKSENITDNIEISIWIPGAPSSKTTFVSEGYTVSQNASSFDIEFDFDYLRNVPAGYGLLVEYTAKMDTSIADLKNVTNSAYLEYSYLPHEPVICYTDSQSVYFDTNYIDNIVKVDGSTYHYDELYFEKITNPGTLPAATGYGAAFSSDGKYMAVTSSSTPYVVIYDISGGTPVKLTNPSTLPTGSGNGVAFSPDSMYLAVAHTTSPFVTVYNLSTGVPIKEANPGTLPTGNGNGVAYSPDGTFLAVAHATTPFVSVYNLSSGIPIRMNASALAGAGFGVAFSPDSKLLAVAHTTTPFISTYDMSGTTIVKNANPGSLPPGNGRSVSFSPDGNLLALGHVTSPFLTVYNVVDEKLGTKLTAPSTAPTGQGNGVAFSSDGNYLAVAHTTTPFVSIYDVSGGSLVRMANPTTLPASTGNGVAFSYNSKYMTVTHATTPFATIYTTPTDKEYYDIALGGAEFNLHKLETLDVPGPNGILYDIGTPIKFTQNDTGIVVPYDDNLDNKNVFTELVSDSDGNIKLYGIGEGLYILREIIPPYEYLKTGHDTFISIERKYNAVRDKWEYSKKFYHDLSDDFLTNAGVTEFTPVNGDIEKPNAFIYIEDIPNPFGTPTISKIIVLDDGSYTDNYAAGIGETLYFAIEIDLPHDLDLYPSYVFKVIDTFENIGDIHYIGSSAGYVYIDNIDVSIWVKGNYSTKQPFPADGCVIYQNWPFLELEFDLIHLLAIPTGYSILIEYPVLINHEFSAVMSASNVAYLEYTCDPNSLEIETTRKSVVNYQTFKLDNVYKVDKYAHTTKPFVKIPNPASLPGSTGYDVAYSPDGQQMAIASASSPYLYLYDISGEQPVRIAGPASAPKGIAEGVAYSPDGQYLAVAHRDSPYITIYDMTGIVPVKISNPATLPASNCTGVAFSPNGEYLAVSQMGSARLVVYRIVDGSFIKLANPATKPTGSAYNVSFSPDSNSLAIAHTSSPYVTIYDLSSGALVKKANPSILPAGNAQGVDFSPDGKYLAVGHSNAPYITIYDISSGVPIKINDPDVYPTSPGSTHTVSFSPDGKYLTETFVNAPRMAIYNMTSGSPIKMAGPDDLPTNSVYSAMFSLDGKYLTVTHAGYPFVTIYTSLSSSVVIPNAKFEIYKLEKQTVPDIDCSMYDIGLPIEFTHGYNYEIVAYDGNPNILDVFTIIESDAKGHLQINGLNPGLYMFVETDAPNGYELMDHNVFVEIAFEQNSSTGKWEYVKKVLNDETNEFLYAAGETEFDVVYDKADGLDVPIYIENIAIPNEELSFSKHIVLEDGTYMDSLGVSVGETVNFVIEAGIPNDLDAYSNYTYTIYDVFVGSDSTPIVGYDTTGTDFLENIEISVWEKGNLLTKAVFSSTGYTITQNWPNIEIEFDYNELLLVPAGYELLIEYSVIVNQNMLDVKEASNTAKLEYTVDSITEETVFTEETVTRFAMSGLKNIWKVDKDSFNDINSAFQKLEDPAVLPTGVINGWGAFDVSFSPDNKLLAVVHADSPALTVYSLASGIPVKLANSPTLPAGSGTGRGVAFSHDGKYLAVGHVNSPYITIFNMTGASPVKLPDPALLPSSQVNGVAFSPDNKYLAVGATGSLKVIIYDISSGIPVKTPDPDVMLPAYVNVRWVAFSPDSKYLAVAHSNETLITIYDLSESIPHKIPDPDILPTNAARSVAFSPDGSYLAVAHQGLRPITVYNMTSGILIKIPDPDILPTGAGEGVAFTPDGKYLALTHSLSPFVSIYRLTDNMLKKVSKTPVIPSKQQMGGVEFSSDGELLAIVHEASPYLSIFKVPDLSDLDYNVSLVDASFTLHTLTPRATPDIDGNYYDVSPAITFTQNAASENIVYDGNPSNTNAFTELISDENGYIQADGLGPGLYMLHEIQAPDGYYPLPYDIFIEISLEYDAVSETWNTVKKVYHDEYNDFLINGPAIFTTVYDSEAEQDDPIYIENSQNPYEPPKLRQYIIEDDKETEDHGVSVGDTVNYAMEVTLPKSLNEFSDYTFVIHNNMAGNGGSPFYGYSISNFLKYLEVFIWIEGDFESRIPFYDYTVVQNWPYFTIEFDYAALQSIPEGYDILILFSVVANRNITDPKSISNTAYIEHTMDPFSGKTTKTKDTVTHVYVSSMKKIYKVDGTAYYGTFAKKASPTVLPTGPSTGSAYSPNGRYYVVTQSTAPYIIIYDMTTGVPARMPDPAALPTGQASGASFSPDGRYLIVTYHVHPYIIIYDLSTGVPMGLPNPGDLPAGAATGVTFSDDGKYFAVTYDGHPHITVYQIIDGIPYALPGIVDYPTGGATHSTFSPDGKYLVVTHKTYPYIIIYLLTGGTPMKISDPDLLPAGDAQSATFSPDGKYLVVTHKNVPYVTIYSLHTGVPVKIADPTDLPAGTGRGATFSPDGRFLVVIFDVSPYIIIYDMTTGMPIKIDGPDIPLDGAPTSVTFSPDGYSLIITIEVYPYVIIYDTPLASGDYELFLSGAEYTLHRLTKLVTPGPGGILYDISGPIQFTSDGNGGYIIYDGDPSELDIYDRLVSDIDGSVQFDGVGPGLYMLREVKAPDGYGKHSYDIYVLITLELDPITGKWVYVKKMYYDYSGTFLYKDGTTNFIPINEGGDEGDDKPIYIIALKATFPVLKFYVILADGTITEHYGFGAGDAVDFAIEVTVPKNLDLFDSYTLIVHNKLAELGDELYAGFGTNTNFLKNIKVFIWANGDPQTKIPFDITGYTVVQNWPGFHVEFDFNALLGIPEGYEILIEYSITANGKTADMGKLTHNAHVEYSSVPGTPATEITDALAVNLYTAGLKDIYIVDRDTWHILGHYFTKLAIPSVIPGGTGYGITFSHDSRYLVVTLHIHPYIIIYDMTSGQPIKIEDLDVPPTGDSNGAAFTADGKYFVVTHDVYPYITIYELVNGIFIKIISPAYELDGQGTGATFSFNGKYLAVTHHTSPFITIYELVGGVWQKTAGPAALPAGIGRGVAFTRDGQYLAVAHHGYPCVTIYVIVGGVPVKIPDLDDLPNGNGVSVSFSPDGMYLAVAYDIYPYIIIYRNNGGTWVKITDPDYFPAGIPHGLSFSHDGRYLSVAHEGHPYLTVYDLYSGAPLKITDLDGLPLDTGYATAFSDDGEYMGVAHDGEPYFSLYKTPYSGRYYDTLLPDAKFNLYKLSEPGSGGKKYDIGDPMLFVDDGFGGVRVYDGDPAEFGNAFSDLTSDIVGQLRAGGLGPGLYMLRSINTLKGYEKVPHDIFFRISLEKDPKTGEWGYVKKVYFDDDDDFLDGGDGTFKVFEDDVKDKHDNVYVEIAKKAIVYIPVLTPSLLLKGGAYGKWRSFSIGETINVSVNIAVPTAIELFETYTFIVHTKFTGRSYNALYFGYDLTGLAFLKDLKVYMWLPGSPGTKILFPSTGYTIKQNWPYFDVEFDRDALLDVPEGYELVLDYTVIPNKNSRKAKEIDIETWAEYSDDPEEDTTDITVYGLLWLAVDGLDDIWKVDGNSKVVEEYGFEKIDDPADPPTGNGQACAFSPDGKYMAIGHMTAPFITIYDVSGGTPIKLAAPAVPPTGIAYGVAFSPDSKYLAVGHYTTPYITIYDMSSGTPVKSADPNMFPPGDASMAAFSPDGKYLAIGHLGSPFITVYDMDEPVPTKINDPDITQGGPTNGMIFSSSGRYLAVAYSGTPFVSVYDMVGDTPIKVDGPDILPTGNAAGITFSLDENTLYVGLTTSPYLAVYDMSDGSLTKMANPAETPGGTVYGATVSPDGKYLALSHDVSPYMTVYDISGAIPVKVEDPNVLPTGAGKYIPAFSPDGKQLVIPHNNTPYLSIYNIPSVNISYSTYIAAAEFSLHELTPRVSPDSKGQMYDIGPAMAFTDDAGVVTIFDGDPSNLNVYHTLTSDPGIYLDGLGAGLYMLKEEFVPGDYKLLGYNIFIEIVQEYDELTDTWTTIKKVYYDYNNEFLYDVESIEFTTFYDDINGIYEPLYVENFIGEFEAPKLDHFIVTENGSYAKYDGTGIGETVNFTIEANVPNLLSQFDDYTYVIHGKFAGNSNMFLGFDDTGEDYLENIEVYMWKNGEPNTKEPLPLGGYTITQNWPYFDIEVDFTTLQSIPKGYEILVEYSGVINENVVDTMGFTSNAWLEYSDDISDALSVGLSEVKTVHLKLAWLDDIWKVDGNSSYEAEATWFEKIGDLNMLPTGNGVGTVFSHNGNYMVVAHSGFPYITIYDMSGDYPEKMTDPTLPTNLAYGAVFSPDDKYLYVANYGAKAVTVYDMNDGSPVKMADPDVLPTANGRGIALSPDGTCLAVVLDVSPFISLYSVDGGSLEIIANPIALPAGTANGIAFSPDGMFLAVAHASSPYITIYDMSGSVPEKLTNPTNLPASTGNGAAFSPDGQYLAIAHQGVPYITVYDMTGEAPEKITDPAIQPTGNGRGVTFSQDGAYMVVTHENAPFVTIYSIIEDIIVKEADVDVSPTGRGNYYPAFSADDKFLAIPHDTYPYITIYRTPIAAHTEYAKPLVNAQFALYKLTKRSSPDVNGNMYDIGLPLAFTDSVVGTIPYDGDPANSNIYYTLKSNPMVSVKGLAPGLYMMRETVAPDGYNKLTYDIFFEITFEYNVIEGKWVYIKKVLQDTENVFLKSVGPMAFTTLRNSLTGIYEPLYIENIVGGDQFPEVGGIGTIAFYLTSIAITMALSTYYVISRKKKALYSGLMLSGKGSEPFIGTLSFTSFRDKNSF